MPMGMMEKRTCIVGLVLLGMAVAVPFAVGQTPSPAPAQAPSIIDEIELTRATIQHERQYIVTRAMDLTEAEGQVFWPLYREYRLEMIKVGDRLVNLILTYADNYQDLTDEVADKLLAEFVGIEKERARLKAKYLPKFKKVLPSKKVARFYQIENKLDVAVLSDVAQGVPLVR